MFFYNTKCKIYRFNENQHSTTTPPRNTLPGTWYWWLLINLQKSFAILLFMPLSASLFYETPNDGVVVWPIIVIWLRRSWSISSAYLIDSCILLSFTVLYDSQNYPRNATGDTFLLPPSINYEIDKVNLNTENLETYGCFSSLNVTKKLNR